MPRLKDILRRPAVQRLLCALIAGYIRLVHGTGRWRVENGAEPARLWDAGRPFILAFWHGRLLMMPYCWRRGTPIRTLISRHPDGRLIAETMRHFDLGSIAGSSSRGGSTAFRAALKSLRDGVSVGFTPDGPRGPRMRASDGVIHAARLSGAPILPCTYAASRRRVLGSWDRFVLALPFARGIVLWGEPIAIARDAGPDEVEAARRLLEARLNDLCARADEACGVTPIAPAALGASSKRDAAGVRA